MLKKPYEKIQLVTPELFLISVKTMICGTIPARVENFHPSFSFVLAGPSYTITYRELKKLLEDAVDSSLNVDDFPAPPAQSAVQATSVAAPTFLRQHGYDAHSSVRCSSDERGDRRFGIP